MRHRTNCRGRTTNSSVTVTVTVGGDFHMVTVNELTHPTRLVARADFASSGVSSKTVLARRWLNTISSGLAATSYKRNSFIRHDTRPKNRHTDKHWCKRIRAGLQYVKKPLFVICCVVIRLLCAKFCDLRNGWCLGYWLSDAHNSPFPWVSINFNSAVSWLYNSR